MAFGLVDRGFADALVILGAAGLVIPAFARIKVSPVIGFILVGLLAGPSGLGRLVANYPWLAAVTISDVQRIEPFAEFGVILLLFSIGLELSFRRLWSMRATVFGIGSAELLASGLIIAVALFLFGQSPVGALALGIALALSSTALILPIAGANSTVGRSAFAMLLFEDLALVPLLLVLGTLDPAVAQSGSSILSLMARGAITVAILFVGGRFLLPRLFAQAARTKSPELFLSASLLVVIIASLATSSVGLSPIIGALLAGLLIAETDYGDEVEVITAPFRGLALGVFLITVGMSLDLSVIFQQWPYLLLAIAGVITIKTLITFMLLRISGMRNAVAAEVGLLMGSPSETTLILLGAASQAALITQTTASFWQMVTAIGLTITPLLAWVGRFAARRIERRSSDDLSELPQQDDGPGTVIFGFGRVGKMVADMLIVHQQRYIAVEADVDSVIQARRENYAVIYGDVVRGGMIDRFDLKRAKALIFTMDDPVLTVRLTQQLRRDFPDLTIVARARDVDHAAELYRAGVTDAVPETLESSLQLSEAVLTDLGVAAGPVIASIHQKREDLRKEIKHGAGLLRNPRLRRTRLNDDATRR